ncbi:MAG: thermonuclease family protein [Chloroflexi bacterium]|nr:thermonuclease family protein [Chloroflexota bacterium]
MTARPERLLGILAVLAIAAVAVAVLAVVIGPDDEAVVRGTPLPASSPVGEGPTGELESAVVVRIADGDTITVEIDGRRERVRYVGVDAPEVANAERGSPAECGADAATDANRALVEGVELTLERDATDRDRFGRLLRHVWVAPDGEWLHVGEALVVDGWVEARSFPPDTLHDARLDRAERTARAERAGIWGACAG